MGRISGRAQDAGYFIHPPPPVFEMFEDAVGNDKVEDAIWKRKGLCHRERKSGGIVRAAARVNRIDALEPRPQKPKLITVS